MHPISLREVHVVRAADLTPGMRRVTLGGPELGAFTSANGLDQPAFRTDGFDDEIRLVFAHPGQSRPLLPVQIEGSVRPPDEGRVLSRAYTVRRWDPRSGELDVDFAKHGTGIATTWAERAEPGDRIHLFGPLLSHALPHDADWLLVAGDETALPAIGRLLDELHVDTRAQVFIEIAEDGHRQPLRDLPGVEVTWLAREGAEAGATTLLLDAVRSSRWPDGRPFAWIAGEQAVVRDLRRHLVGERQLPKTEIEFTGYWKRSTVVPLAEDAALPDPEKSSAADERFHDLIEIVPPIAIRAAAGLGLGELIAQGVTTPAALAAASGSDARALGKVLRYLHAIDVLTTTAPGHYALTEVGEYLADDYWSRVLAPDGAHARMEAGIAGLAESVRTGSAAYASVTGQTFAALRTEQWYEDRYLEEAADDASMLAAAIATSPALDDIEHVVIHSAGASEQAQQVLTARPDLRVTICALPAQAHWLRHDLPRSIPDPDRRARITVVEQSIFEEAPVADAVLIVNALAAHPDADAAHALRRTATNLAPGGRVLLLEDLFEDEALDEHHAEHDLLALTRDGTGLRTPPELRSVIESAGLTITAVHTIGWGTPLHELTPWATADVAVAEPPRKELS
ncbi:siderophore-interacting protein [Occultella aeris]|nr:siderophore-interacting protein [Occultella aeris]